MEATNVTQEQDPIGMISHNMKYLTNRLVNTEMALDVFLGILFEKDDGLQKQFEDLFKERMESIRQQYEAQEATMEAEQAAASAADAADGRTPAPEENIDVVVTPEA